MRCNATFQTAYSMALTWSFRDLEYFDILHSKQHWSVGLGYWSLQGIRMLLVSWGMGHGVNIALGKIGYASPVKWDNASLPCTALHQANASLHSPPLSLTLHWTLLAAFSPLPWIAPYTLHYTMVRLGACKGSVYQSLDSIPGFTR